MILLCLFWCSPLWSRTDDNEHAQCGKLCLQVALEALDVPPKAVAALRGEMGKASPSGYSIQELARAAEAHALKTTAVTTTLENLASRTEPLVCITLINNNHFVILYDIEDQTVHVVDPPREYSVPRSSFERAWTGHSLLIGRSPFASEESVTAARKAAARTRLLMVTAVPLLLAAIAAVFVVRRRFPRRGPTPSGVPLCIAAAVLALHSGCGPRSQAARSEGATTSSMDPGSPVMIVEPRAYHFGTILAAPTPGPIRVETTVVETDHVTAGTITVLVSVFVSEEPGQ